jgi:hypothetical protein
LIACSKNSTPGHFRHSLVNQKKRDRIVSDFFSSGQYRAPSARIGAQNPVIGRVFSPQIALDRPQNFRIVVNRDNRRFCHNLFP